MCPHIILYKMYIHVHVLYHTYSTLSDKLCETKLIARYPREWVIVVVVGRDHNAVIPSSIQHAHIINDLIKKVEVVTRGVKVGQAREEEN